LQIEPATPIFAPLELSGSWAGAGAKELGTTFDPSLGTIDLYLQDFFLDAGAPSGLSGTNLLHIPVE
jgi:hypothetical protein